MSHEEREHRSAPVLTDKELGLMWCRVTGSAFGMNEARNVAMLALHTARAERDELQQECNDAAERLRWGVEEIGRVRAERDAALAEVARMRPVVEAAGQWRDSPPMDRDYHPLVAAVDAYRAEVQP